MEDIRRKLHSKQIKNQLTEEQFAELVRHLIEELSDPNYATESESESESESEDEGVPEKITIIKIKCDNGVFYKLY
jgi:hypothetical protein